MSLDVATPFIPGGADKRALVRIVDHVGLRPSTVLVPRGQPHRMLALSVS